MKGKFLTLLLLTAVTVSASAQKTLVDGLQHDVPGQGTVRIIRDARLDSLIGTSYDVTVNSQIKALGYRIQVYAGNNTREARSKALEAEEYIRQNFPGLPVYVAFKSPRWLCTAGDFLSYEEAFEQMRRIKAKSTYKGLLILPNQEINIPLY